MTARTIRIAAAVTAAVLTFSQSSWRSAASAQDSHSSSKTKQSADIKGSGSGTLLALLPSGKKMGTCPLQHTDVKADVSGYVARVTVKQTFENPYKDKIEAVYTFPLPDSAAVDEMTMKVGNRTIHGTVKKREEARQVYEQAKQAGQVASLLDQERTNIFTQSVANIMPGEKVEITLKYVDLLPYEDGKFTFAFPTVVGPRFMPGTATGADGTGHSPNTTAVPDASHISPPIAKERSGHDISLDVHINAGVAIGATTSKLHDVTVTRSGQNEEEVVLKDKNTIPNKDFVLTWDVASDKLQSGYLTHTDAKSGYFTLMLMPPKRVTPHQAAPKEMIFLVDCSGSQQGPPLEKAKETMTYILDHMNANDTFQIISFSDHLRLLSEKPIKVNRETVEKAKNFIQSLQANGGTWMAPAVEKACSIPADEHRLRIVTFMTDGYVGNDYEIIGMVKKLRDKSRWFPFGTGNSVNRTLIDGIANEGGGEPDYVLLNSPGNEVGKKFYERISSPVLTDVKIDFHGLPVKEVFPTAISDVWAQRPLYITGRYLHGAAGTVTISGFTGGKPYKQDLQVSFPDKQTANEVLGSIWARKKVDRLMAEDWFGAQHGAVNKELKDEIVATALEHHIMTQYTSFVAVEEKRVTTGGAPRTVAVPVELPDGVNRQMGYGDEAADAIAPAGFLGASVAFKTRAKAPVFGQLAGASGYVARQIAGKGIVPPAPPSMPTMANLPVPTPKPTRAQAVAPQREVAMNEGLAKDKKKQASDPRSENKLEKEEAKPLTTAFAESKLDSALRTLVHQAETEAGGLAGQTARVRVRIEVSNTTPALINKIKALRAVVTLRDKAFLIAEIPLSSIGRLTMLSEVTSISKYEENGIQQPHMKPALPLPHITGQLPKKEARALD